MGITISRRELKRWRTIAKAGAHLTAYANQQLDAMLAKVTEAKQAELHGYSQLGALTHMLMEIEAGHIEPSAVAKESGVIKGSLTDNAAVLTKVRDTYLEGYGLLSGAVAELTASYDVLLEAVNDEKFFLSLEETSASRYAKRIIKMTGSTGFEALYAFVEKYKPVGFEHKMGQISTNYHKHLIINAQGQELFDATMRSHQLAYSFARMEALLEKDTVSVGGKRREKLARRYRKVYARALKGYMPKLPVPLQGAVLTATKAMAEAEVSTPTAEPHELAAYEADNSSEI